jgi:hypothetical protein
MQVFIAVERISYNSYDKILDILMQDFIAIEGGNVDHVGTGRTDDVVASETTLTVEIILKDLVVVEVDVTLGVLDDRVVVATVK